MEGIVGRIQNGNLIGWAYGDDLEESASIRIVSNGLELAKGKADLLRPDLLDFATQLKGFCGFKIPVNISQIVNGELIVYANGQVLPLSKKLRRIVTFLNPRKMFTQKESFFFIHVPKTAGTTFKRLIEGEFEQSKIFPNLDIVKRNNGLYPTIGQLLASDYGSESTKMFLGHFPFASKSLFVNEPKKLIILRDPVQRSISNIFHMKNNDKRLKGLSPEQIYTRGKWSFQNLQVRYLTDSKIASDMLFTTDKSINRKMVNAAIENLKSCEFVGLSEEMERTVALANKMFGWSLKNPGIINKAKSSKEISEALKSRIEKDNQPEYLLYRRAKIRFNYLCKKYGI